MQAVREQLQLGREAANARALASDFGLEAEGFEEDANASIPDCVRAAEEIQLMLRQGLAEGCSIDELRRLAETTISRS